MICLFASRVYKDLAHSRWSASVWRLITTKYLVFPRKGGSGFLFMECLWWFPVIVSGHFIHYFTKASQTGEARIPGSILQPGVFKVTPYP